MVKTIIVAYQDCPGLPDALFAGCSGIRFTGFFKQGSTTQKNNSSSLLLQ
jgi:hypothetical protein